MRRAHIAIFSYPIPASVHPTLTIVETLCRRGHRVTYATSERFAARVAALGAEVIQIPVLRRPHSERQRSAIATDWYDLSSKVLTAVSSFFEANVPDLVLHDAAHFVGLVIANRASAPILRMTAELAPDESNRDRYLPPSSTFRHDLDECLAQARTFLAEHGIHLRDARYDRTRPTIYFFPREFQIGAHPIADHLYAARCAAERHGLKPWKGADAGGKKRVLITASTVYIEGPQYFRMCLEALSGLGYHSLLAIGDNNDVSLFKSLPPDTEILVNVPQVVAMPQVDLIIGLGGPTTQMEAAYHGVPLLMLTNGGAEAEVCADIAQLHGIGIHLRQSDTNERNIRRHTVDILQRGVLRDSVRRVQSLIKNGAGGEEAANWIESHLPC